VGFEYWCRPRYAKPPQAPTVATAAQTSTHSATTTPVVRIVAPPQVVRVLQKVSD